MNDFIDIYCERTAPGFWNEPFNALTNIAFFIAAFFAFRLAKKENTLNAASGALVFFLLCIGTGSFLFYTLATAGAQLADVIPILLYQGAFLGLYARRVMSASTRAVAVLLFIFLLLIAAVRQVPDEVLNGSAAYLPALFFLAGFAFWHVHHAVREAWLLPAAAGIFVVSLALRSLDMQFCPQIPVGLHFLWHLLNGLLLCLTARAYILNAGKGR